MNVRSMQKANSGLHFPEFLSEILSDHRPMLTDKLGEKFRKLGEKFGMLGGYNKDNVYQQFITCET